MAELELNGDPEFKEENRLSWRANTQYWLNSPLRQVEDTKEFVLAKLPALVHSGAAVVEMGCGSGWLLQFLLDLGIDCTYLGLDFTVEFIEHLRSEFKDVSKASFEVVDLETRLPARYVEKADVVFCAFALFEMTALSVAIENACRMLRPGGRLVILTIDPAYLMLAVSKTMDDFRSVLAAYEGEREKGRVLHFFQNIDLGDAESTDLRYASVLYSLADYLKEAKRQGMRLDDYDEVVKTSKFIPKVYQFIVFEKNT